MRSNSERTCLLLPLFLRVVSEHSRTDREAILAGGGGSGEGRKLCPTHEGTQA